MKEFSNELQTKYNVWLWPGVDGTQTLLGVWNGVGRGWVGLAYGCYGDQRKVCGYLF
jgi:hypothetical protein